MNRKLIRVFGVQRSGLHAVADWIKLSHAEQFGYSIIFENAVSLERPNEIAKFLPLKGDLAEPFLWMTEHEDCVLIDLPNIHPKLSANYEITDVVVVRDVFNTMASRRKMNGNMFNRRAIQLWKQFAFEAKGSTSFLGPKKLVVNFNDWIDSANRSEYAKELQITGIGSQTDKQAAGSSWQPNVPASELKLTERWKNYIDDSSFWNLFDAQTYELNASIFGENTDIKKLLGI